MNRRKIVAEPDGVAGLYYDDTDTSGEDGERVDYTEGCRALHSQQWCCEWGCRRRRQLGLLLYSPHVYMCRKY